MGINLSAWYEALGMVFLHTAGHQHALQWSPRDGAARDVVARGASGRAHAAHRSAVHTRPA